MQIEKKSNPKILLVQFRPAGDVLLLTPVVKALKIKWPDCHVSFMVNEKESILVKDYELIDDLMKLKKQPKNGIANYYKYLKENLSIIRSIRKNKFDIIIDFIGNPKSALFTFLSGSPVRIGRNLRGRSYAYNRKIEIHDKNINTVLRRLRHLQPLGLNSGFISPVLTINAMDFSFAKTYIKSLKINTDRPIVFLAPNSPRRSRRWKAEYFISTGKVLREKYNSKILLAWGPGEEEHTKAILNGIGNDAEMIPKTSLTEMAAIFSKGHLMIANDGGPKHLANAVGVRTITIYGPTNPYVWNDIDMKKNPALMADVPCIQCENRECPLDRHICMEKLTPDIVLKFADSILKKSFGTSKN
jgi:heptosyltransferase III